MPLSWVSRGFDVQNATAPCLELDRIVCLPALGAAGAVHIRIIRIDISAFSTAEDAVGACGRFKAAATQFAVNPQGGESRQKDGNVGEDECGDRHAGGGYCVPGLVRFVEGTTKVAHSKTISPQVRDASVPGPPVVSCGPVGAKRAALA